MLAELEQLKRRVADSEQAEEPWSDGQELPLSEQALPFLAVLVRSSPLAFIGATLEGRIVVWSQGAERLYGYAAVEAMGRTMDFLHPPDAEEDFLSLWRAMLQEDAPVDRPVFRVRKDGGRVAVRSTAIPVRDAEDRSLGLAFIDVD